MDWFFHVGHDHRRLMQVYMAGQYSLIVDTKRQSSSQVLLLLLLLKDDDDDFSFATQNKRESMTTTLLKSVSPLIIMKATTPTLCLSVMHFPEVQL